MTADADRSAALAAEAVETCLGAIAELTAAGRASPAETAALAACLGHARKIVQRRAAEAFAALAACGADVAPLLRSGLAGPDLRGRWGAAYALALVGPPPPEAVPVLLEALGADDGDLRWAAARILVGLGPAPLVPRLCALARTGNAPARKMALYCLRDLVACEPAAEAAAVAALRDPDGHVRLAAQAALPRVAVDREGAARHLLDALGRSAIGERRAAAAALGTLGVATPAVLDGLRAAAAGDDPPLERAARGALRRLEHGAG
jgi:HEAT repeat protein